MEQQEKLRERLKTLPSNLIIVGQKYSGKKTLVNEIAPTFYWVEGKVENLRNLKRGDFVFADVDEWSPACFSAMLKMLEENEDHIIITCKNIGHYCDCIGQIEFATDELIKSVDKLEYKEDYDLNVYMSVVCNRLLERIKNGEDLRKELLISSKYNAAKNLKSLNKKQFIVNWQLDMKGMSEEWRRL